MRQAKRHLELLAKLAPGKVYTRADLASQSKSVDRELKRLDGHSLKKVGPGLYYYPATSRFGPLPPDEHELISEFLQSNDFMVMPATLYNNLGLGLTQLFTTVKVYNYKRHATISLANREYEFRRPNNGFPKELTKEFLLIDLLNNIDQFGEDPKILLENVARQVNNFDTGLLLKLASKYGKIATKKFFKV